jgi:hypothetical protein
MPEVSSSDLAGAWLLESWKIHYGDQVEAGYPFGPDPVGLLIYSSDGWMSATVSRALRPPFPGGQSPRQMDAGAVAEAYWSYFHYAGTWRIEGDQVIHSVVHSLNPNMAGTLQVRHMKLDGQRLTLTGLEPHRGDTRRHVLLWKRPAGNAH